MTLTDINWKQRAREFCQKNNSLEVANVEAAMQEAAALAVQCLTERVSQVRQNLETNRRKANAPQ